MTCHTAISDVKSADESPSYLTFLRAYPQQLVGIIPHDMWLGYEQKTTACLSQVNCALPFSKDSSAVVQAEPFTHNKHYIQLLRDQALLSSVQVMSRVYLADTTDERVKTPQEAIDATSKHPWFRPERFSLR